jgi:hypothetical protein
MKKRVHFVLFTTDSEKAGNAKQEVVSYGGTQCLGCLDKINNIL